MPRHSKGASGWRALRARNDQEEANIADVFEEAHAEMARLSVRQSDDSDGGLDKENVNLRQENKDGTDEGTDGSSPEYGG